MTDDALMEAALAQAPGLDPAAIEDAIVGCSFPEGEQGMNIARVASVLAGLGNTIGGVTVNRYCASGITAVQMAADRIRVGEADVMFAGGVESMSMIPMGGNKPSLSPLIFERDENIGIAYGMGLTAEKVASQWQIGREAQDAFAVESHRRATAAIAAVVLVVDAPLSLAVRSSADAQLQDLWRIVEAGRVLTQVAWLIALGFVLRPSATPAVGHAHDERSSDREP